MRLNSTSTVNVSASNIYQFETFDVKEDLPMHPWVRQSGAYQLSFKLVQLPVVMSVSAFSLILSDRKSETAWES